MPTAAPSTTPRPATDRRQIFYSGMGRLTEASVLNITNTSHAVAADIDVREGGAVTLSVDGEQVGEGRLERTVPLVFSVDETCDVDARWCGASGRAAGNKTPAHRGHSCKRSA